MCIFKVKTESKGNELEPVVSSNLRSLARPPRASTNRPWTHSSNDPIHHCQQRWHWTRTAFSHPNTGDWNSDLVSLSDVSGYGVFLSAIIVRGFLLTMPLMWHTELTSFLFCFLFVVFLVYPFYMWKSVLDPLIAWDHPTKKQVSISWSSRVAICTSLLFYKYYIFHLNTIPGKSFSFQLIGISFHLGFYLEANCFHDDTML